MTGGMLNTIYGPFLAEVPDEDLIHRFLCKYGEWGLLECEFASTLVAPGFTVVDGGAFLGTFSLGMARLGAGRVVAVEPNPVVQASLQHNLQRNSKIPFAIARAAIGVPGTSKQALRTDPQNLGSTKLVPLSGDSSAEPITIRTLQDIRSDYGPYDLLKLDIEGAEFDGLRSDAAYIRDKCSAVILECNDTKASDPIFEFLTWAGFQVHYFAFPAFNPANYLGATDRIFPISYEACLVGSKALRPKLSALHSSKECILKEIHSPADLEQATWLTPRWGKEEWVSMTRVELIALVGRLTQGNATATEVPRANN